jgi:hypothetical protein
VALRYEVVTINRAGKERRRQFTTDDELERGSVLLLNGRYWLIERSESSVIYAKPARYRVRLHHPDGREEIGAFRRFREEAPRLGHSFTTIEDGVPASWQVVDERVASDEDGEPFLDLRAERDFAELEAVAGEADEDEALPDHELEHALARRDEESLPEGAVATLSRAESEGLSVELAALEAGEAPDWEEAERYIRALILEEIEDDLIEMCGVNPDRDPRETWLDKVKERLLEDLRRFREDVEGDHDEIEEWDFHGGRVYASVGSLEDEADPDSGHGWMCRLLDVSALGAGGFERVRKASLTA